MDGRGVKDSQACSQNGISTFVYHRYSPRIVQHDQKYHNLDCRNDGGGGGGGGVVNDNQRHEQLVRK